MRCKGECFAERESKTEDLHVNQKRRDAGAAHLSGSTPAFAAAREALSLTIKEVYAFLVVSLYIILALLGALVFD